MAREYMRVDEWERWVPDVGQEREIAAVNQDKALSMEIRFLTREERKRYDRLTRQVMRGAADDEEAEKAMRELFRTHVRNVRGYVYDGEPVMTGVELFDHEEEDLIFAVYSAMRRRSALEEGLAKKLCSPSDCKSSAENRSGDGDAAAAIQQSNQDTQAE